MSHINKISHILLTDLASVAGACERLGALLTEGQTTHEYYGGKGRCEHAIGVPGVTYEVGLTKEGEGYSLNADLYGSPYPRHAGGTHDGNRLRDVFGEGFTKLIDAYSTEVLRKKARAEGYICSEKVREDGRIALTITK